MRLQTHRILFVALLSLGTSGCWLGGPKPTIKVPPVPLPKAPVAPPPAPIPPPAKPAETTAPPATTPEPTKKPTPRRPRPAPKTPPVQQPTPEPPAVLATPPPAAPVPAPRLGEMLSPAQTRQAEADFQVSLQRAQTALSRASGRNLTPAQRDTLERIRVFISQAQGEKQRDLATALQLARRADLLGQDLLKGLQQ